MSESPSNQILKIRKIHVQWNGFFLFSAHFSCPKSLDLPKVLLAAPGFIGTFGIGALGMVSSEGWKIRSFQPFFIHPKAQHEKFEIYKFYESNCQIDTFDSEVYRV